MTIARTTNPSTYQRRQQPHHHHQPPPGAAPGAPPNQTPSCKCPAPAVQRTTRKPGPNQGRQFFTCSKPMGQQCGYFEWADKLSAHPSLPSSASGPASRHNNGNPSGGARPNPSPFFQRAQHMNDNHDSNNNNNIFNSNNNNTNNVHSNTGANRSNWSTGGPQRAGAAPQPSPFAVRAQAANPGQNGPGLNAAPAETNGTVRVALHDLERLSFEVGPLLPRAARGSLQSFPGAESRVDDKGVRTVLLEVDRLAEFRAHAQREAKVTVRVDPPDWVLRAMAQFRADEAAREARGDVVTQPLDEVLPQLMCDKLMQFQWHGVHFALKRGGRCLIADDMGLGKTLQAIAVARVYIHDWPLLIICPSSLRLNWKHELLQWLSDDLCADDIRVIMTGKDINLSLKRVTIVSYDLARKIPPDFVKRCRFMIADESHYLKSMSALRSKAVVPLLKNSRRAILLSGTPALSRPVELYPQLHAVAPKLFPSYTDYVNRYCNAFQGRFGLDVSGSRNLPELHNLLSSTILIRRRKDDVLKQLPEKRRHIMWVETKSGIIAKLRTKRTQFDNVKASIAQASDGEAIGLEAKMKGLQNEMWQLSADAKIDSIMEVCKVTAESNVKFIVFAHHASVMNELCTFLTGKMKLGIIRIDGNTPQKARQDLCKKFQEDDSCRVAALSITAAGVGLTLTKATVVIFAELYWNPGSLLQAEDRAHRIGQRDCVLVKYLLAKETLDEQMWAMVRKKLTVVGQSLTGKAGRMDAKEDGKEGDEEIEDADGKGKADIRSFFKRKAEKRARDAEKERIVSQEHNDEVVVIDEETTGASAQLGRNAGATPGIGSDETIDVDAPIASLPLSAPDGASQQRRKKARTETGAGPPVVEDPLDEMFPEKVVSLDGPDGRQDGLESPEVVLVDDDLALARRLQAQYEREAKAENIWKLD